jgi:hypothetical protein
LFSLLTGHQVQYCIKAFYKKWTQHSINFF